MPRVADLPVSGRGAIIRAPEEGGAPVSDVEEIASFRRRRPETRPAAGSDHKPQHAAQVAFDRAELNQILSVYGRMVAAGEMRDYAIDMLRERAVFSIFRHSSEYPVYRVEKDPRLARRQGAYSVISATGLILKRGHDLGRVLGVLDRKLKIVS
jgi:hypothetical protein